jgi:hypothetical protein
MKDGKYGVYWYDNAIAPLGVFEVKGNRITNIEGDFVKDILSLGNIEGMNLYRIHSLNNGYYHIMPIKQTSV